MNKELCEQKKKECWDEFQVANRTTLETTKQAFEYIFDRAFALGKQAAEEAMIEPYTEPTEEASQNVTRSGILTQLANGDLQVRLQVAAMSLQGILANPEYYNEYEKYFESVPIAGSYTSKEKYYAELALSYADALLAESQKGGAK